MHPLIEKILRLRFKEFFPQQNSMTILLIQIWSKNQTIPLFLNLKVYF